MQRLSLHIQLQHFLPFSLLLQYKATDRSYVKGDFMFRSPNVIEMVTKTHAVVQENLSRKLKVVIKNE